MLCVVRAGLAAAFLALVLAPANSAEKTFRQDMLGEAAIKLEAQIKSDAGTVTLAIGTSANSLILVGNTQATIIDQAGNALTLGNGGPAALLVVGSQNATIKNGTMPFGTNEGLLLTGSVSLFTRSRPFIRGQWLR